MQKTGMIWQTQLDVSNYWYAYHGCCVLLRTSAVITTMKRHEPPSSTVAVQTTWSQNRISCPRLCNNNGQKGCPSFCRRSTVPRRPPLRAVVPDHKLQFPVYVSYNSCDQKAGCGCD